MTAVTVFAATTWHGPTSAPPLSPNVTPLVNFSGLVDKGTLVRQYLNTALEVSNGYNYPVYLGYQGAGNDPKVGVLAIGQSGAPSNYASVAPLAGNFGIVGYGRGLATNYGVYGLSNGGIGIKGSAPDAADYAGYFVGKVAIINNPNNAAVLGSLTMSNLLSATTGISTASSTARAIKLTAPSALANSIAIDGGVLTGSLATTTGVFGYGIAARGINATTTNEIYGAKGTSSTNYGVYAYATSSSAIIGEADSLKQNGAGVYGEGIDYGIYGSSIFKLTGFDYYGGAGQHGGAVADSLSGVGIFACGTSTFDGLVRVLNSLSMGVSQPQYVEDASDVIQGKLVSSDTTLTQSGLDTMLNLCTIATNCVAGDKKALP